MNDIELEAILHPKENARYQLTMTVVIPAIIVGMLIVLGTLGLALLYVGLILAIIWFSLRMIEASLMRNTVRVSEKNFSHIHRIVQEIKQDLNYNKDVDVFVVEEGSFNLFILSFFQRRFIILNPETLSDKVTDSEMRFLIARFIGYLRARHDRFVLFRILINSIRKLAVFNLLLNPYERTVVKSGDRIGLAMIGGDINSALAAMNKFFIGADCGRYVNPDGIIEQYESTTGKFFTSLSEILYSHPSLALRYSELMAFAYQRFPAQFQELKLRSQIERSFISPVSNHSGRLTTQARRAVDDTAPTLRQ